MLSHPFEDINKVSRQESYQQEASSRCVDLENSTVSQRLLPTSNILEPEIEIMW